MTTPSNDDSKSTSTTSTTTTKANSASSQQKDKEPGLVTVRLLATSWQRRVPDTKDPVEFERYTRGQEFDISEKEFEILTSPDQFKPAVEKVEE